MAHDPRRIWPRVEIGSRIRDQRPPTYSIRLDHATQYVVRDLWWRLNRHHGAELPPEHGLIVIPGGRA